MDIGVKPKLRFRKVTTVECGNCGRNICTVMSDSDNEAEKKRSTVAYHTYCSNCGAVVDWSDFYEAD